MRIKAHRAVYGDVNGAHELIEPKTNTLPFLKKLTRFTDRPGHLPSHINWRPYVSGFPYEDYYVLTRTFPNPTASRAGMVLTQALVFELEGAAQMPELTPALLALPSQLQKGLDDNPVEILVPDTAVHEDLPHGFAKLVHELFEEDRGDRPVVWCGQDGFEEVISALWRGLWPEARRTLRFRLGYMPQDIEGQGLTVVAVPEGAENRWGGYPQARPSDVLEPRTKAEAFLLRHSEGDPLRKLISEMGAEPRAISDLKKIEACHGYVQRLRADHASIDAGGVRSMVRLLGALAPKVDQGKALKSEMLNVLLELTVRGAADDLRALRNFDPEPFEAGERKITGAVTAWVREHILARDVAAVKQSAELIQASLVSVKSSSSAVASWGRSVIDAIRGVLSDWPKGAAQTVWQWWQLAPTLVEGIGPLIPNSQLVEAKLAQYCPRSLTGDTCEAVTLLAQLRDWFVLHAVTLAAFCNPAEALRRQLLVDKDAHHLAGLRALAGRVPTTSLLEFAIETGEPRLLKLAGESCARDAELMKHLDVERAEWRKVWLYAVEAGAPTMAGIGNAREVADSLISLLVSEAAIEKELLAHLAETPYADLTLHPQRRDVWEHMDARLQKLFLNATADGWLQHFGIDPNFDQTVEATLAEEVLKSSRIARHIGTLETGRVSFLVNLFRRFTRLGSQHFRDLLGVALNSRQPVNGFDAVLLGSFIREKGWREVAKQLVGYLDANRHDLAPSVRECQSLLGWFDSFRLKFTGKLDGTRITDEDWWGALYEIAAELYQYGPDQDQLWERAGGDLSVLNRHQSGRATWADALNMLRHGGGGENISPGRLIGEMRRDYQNSHKLHMLQQWLDRR